MDYAGGTPVSKSVLSEMQKYSKFFANPSGLYEESLLAKEKLIELRTKIAKILNIQKNEIVFTSGGTESNNLALFGVFESFKKKGIVPHFVTTTIEHSSILEVMDEIKSRGAEVTKVSVSKDGVVNLEELKNSIKENTVLVSIGMANSEIGTIQPLSEVNKILNSFRNENKHYPYLHVDAGSSPLYLNIDTNRLGINLLTLDGSKIYGPKGVGALIVKSYVEISPLIYGGGQERGLRSGTENISSIAGFALALLEADSNRKQESGRLTEIRDYGIKKILETFALSELNGSHKHRTPNNINICFKGLDAEFATVKLDLLGVSSSYSSSCLTLKDDFSSYVIRALGKDIDCSKSSLRFTLGRDSKMSDIDFLVECLKKVVQ